MRDGFLHRFLRHPAALAGASILGLIALAALLAGVLAPGSPQAIAGSPFLWPGEEGHWLGTDVLGRDILAGLLFGARVSLLVGLGAAGLSILLGVVTGTVAGYYRGRVDDALMRLTEAVQTMPSLVFTIVVVVVAGPSLPSIVLAIGLTGWPQVARLVRAEALRLRQAEFVQAAIASGLGDAAILARHVVPNAISPVVVAASILVAHAILTEASLAFLGLGDPNAVSWGSMIGTAREALRSGWYMAAIPGLAICVAVLGISLLGSGLNDLLNPRLRDG
ncbi:ABC transporter permease [Roseomonas sp. 18066]|uniref:ABC transporter permease n=1 Tax=Roseomonas sp. 18066 TaxID=2681412 RepID=UPI001357C536|nr:ABC transporter permease [Roseomonas sp. 18066]